MRGFEEEFPSVIEAFNHSLKAGAVLFSLGSEQH